MPDVGSEIDAGTTYDDLGLSGPGVDQAAALARRLALRRKPPVAVYSSPTRRAVETAMPLATALGVRVALDDGLREIALGDIGVSGFSAAERAQAIRSRLDELAAMAQRDGSWQAVPGAEPAASVRARMAVTVEAIVARHRGQHVALFSHAGTINAYVAGIIGAARDFFFLTANTSVSSIAFADGSPMLIRLNDTAHLEPSAFAAAP